MVGQYDIETGEEIQRFNSVKEAAAKLGVRSPAISNHLHGRSQSVKGFVFKKFCQK